jgi:methylmalonyl-CoA carboxyltransferase small subunit
LKVQIVIDGKTYEVDYDATDKNSSSSAPSVEQPQSIVLPTPQVPVPGTADIDESKLCRSPVAGIVARINVEPGQSVQAGDILLVVEAMKMENNLTAAAEVKVKFVNVKVGDTVKLNQIVIDFE